MKCVRLALWHFVFVVGIFSCKQNVSEVYSKNGKARDLVIPEAEQVKAKRSKLDSDARNLRLQVNGIRQHDAASQICYVYAVPDVAAESAKLSEGSRCERLESGKTTTDIYIKDIPMSAYMFVFHDQNSNGKLDYTVFDVLVEKREGVAEGYSFVEDPSSKSSESIVRRMLILSPGENANAVTLTYGNTALENFLIEKGWEYVFSKAKERKSDEFQ